MKTNMRKFLTIGVCFGLLLGLPSNALAANLKLNIEVWSEDSALQLEQDETIPAMKEIQKTLLKNCKSELSYRVGSKVRAVNQSGNTVGIGSLTSVKIGKVYSAIQPTYGTKDQVDGVTPPNLYPTFFAPCIFTGSIINLRSANFYTLYIGNAVTSEYDVSEFKKINWKLDLFIEDINCYNYNELKIPRGCND
jgi:hypothetical protein